MWMEAARGWLLTEMLPLLICPIGVSQVSLGFPASLNTPRLTAQVLIGSAVDQLSDLGQAT